MIYRALSLPLWDRKFQTELNTLLPIVVNNLEKPARSNIDWQISDFSNYLLETNG